MALKKEPRRGVLFSLLLFRYLISQDVLPLLPQTSRVLQRTCYEKNGGSCRNSREDICAHFLSEQIIWRLQEGSAQLT